jgi:FkbM family methyltransferase
MMFISYAQNFEDVMLWRALKHVEKGFYIDVGAQDPVIDSISLAFYEHGWRGVHIEPTQQYSKLLRDARPDECVEQIAIGSFQGNLEFYEISDTGLSTASAEIAKRHEEAGFSVVRSEVAVVTLDAIFENHAATEIHWLKIDVEGLEKSVLESWKISVARPWILVIESTRPLTQDESYMEWENLILDKGYCFAYFDGLNRFYVHQDHQELLQFFKAPPNIFDGFFLSGLASHPFYQLVAKKTPQAEAETQQPEAKTQQAEAKARQAEAKARHAEAKARHAEAKARHAEAKARHAEVVSNQALVQLQAVYASASWRVTAPFRVGGGLLGQPSASLRNMVNYVIHSAIENWRRPVSRIIRVVLNRPQLSHRVNQFMLRFPALHHQLIDVARQSGVVPSASLDTPDGMQSAACTKLELANLSPRARQIHADLKAAIKNKKGNG